MNFFYTTRRTLWKDHLSHIVNINFQYQNCYNISCLIKNLKLLLIQK